MVDRRAIAIVAKHKTDVFRLGWISLQQDGAISVGLSDSTMVVKEFLATQFLWNANNRVTAEYLVPDEPSALQKVLKPHITFHPPIWFHLTEDKGKKSKKKPFLGIADIEIALGQQDVVPWLRFTSKPLNKANSSKGEAPDAVALCVDTLDLSVRFAVDFVSGNYQASTDAETIIEHGKFRLTVRIEAVTSQIATLAWLHEH